MDIQGLKDEILQLAIEGKLVGQDLNDEAASVLLEKIKEERGKLIKEKKIRIPMKLSPIEDDEKPFEISKTWEWVRLGEITQFINGDRGKNYPSKNDLVDEGIPFINAGHLNNSEIEFSQMNYITDNKYETLSNGKIKIKDIIYCLRGTLGKCSINTTLEKGAIASSLVIIRNYKDLSEKFLYCYLMSPLGKDMISKYDNGTAQPNLSAGNVRKYLFPLPPLEEQERIVEKVDKLFALIDELGSDKEEILETINLTRNQVLQEAIQGKLIKQNPQDEPTSILLEKIKKEKERLRKEKKIKKEKPLPDIIDEEKPFDIPNGWEWVRLGECCVINPRNLFEDEKEASFVPMALIDEGFKNNHTSEVKVWKQIKRGFTHFAENDVAVAKITPCFENKKSVIMKNLINGVGAGTTEIHIIRCINESVLPEYILNIFKTDEFIKKGVQTYTGTAGHQRISKDYILNLPIPIGPLEEQKRIVEKVDMVMNMLDELENELISKK